MSPSEPVFLKICLYLDVNEDVTGVQMGWW
jgi:hypothetical protein